MRKIFVMWYTDDDMDACVSLHHTRRSAENAFIDAANIWAENRGDDEIETFEDARRYWGDCIDGHWDICERSIEGLEAAND